MEPDAHAIGAPTGLQLDLLTVILRLKQLDQMPWFDSSDFIWHRIVTCDIPRLIGYLDPATAEWAEREMREVGLA